LLPAEPAQACWLCWLWGLLCSCKAAQQCCTGECSGYCLKYPFSSIACHWFNTPTI